MIIIIFIIIIFVSSSIHVLCVCTEEAEPEEPEPASNAYGRRRSRAVLYQLSGHYKSDKPKTGKLKLNNVSFVNFCQNIIVCYNNISGHPATCDCANVFPFIVSSTIEYVWTIAYDVNITTHPWKRDSVLKRMQHVSVIIL